MLLVLDNCEHVIDAAARLAESVVRLCPRAIVLATSRESLRIDGEHVYRVPPLDVPPEQQADPDKILAHSAVQLFTARMRAVGLAEPRRLPTILPRSSRSAGISTGFRSPSSSRRRAPPRWARSGSLPGCTTGSSC